MLNTQTHRQQGVMVDESPREEEGSEDEEKEKEDEECICRL